MNYKKKTITDKREVRQPEMCEALPILSACATINFMDLVVWQEKMKDNPGSTVVVEDQTIPKDNQVLQDLTNTKQEPTELFKYQQIQQEAAYRHHFITSLLQNVEQPLTPVIRVGSPSGGQSRIVGGNPSSTSTTPMYYRWCIMCRKGIDFMYENQSNDCDEKKEIEQCIISEMVSYFSSRETSDDARESSASFVIDVESIRDDSDDRGATIFHRACQFNRVELIKFLLSVGRHNLLTLPDRYGATPLHYACFSGSLDAVLTLLYDTPLCGKLDISSIRDQFGNSPLHVAMNASFFDILQALIDYQPHLINLKKAGSSLSLLHIAAENFNINGLRFILERNAHRNPTLHTMDQFKCTPIMHAIKCFSKEEKEKNANTMDYESNSCPTSPTISIPLSTSSQSEDCILSEQTFNMECTIEEPSWNDRWRKNRTKLQVLGYLLSKEIDFFSKEARRERLASQVDNMQRNYFHLAALYECPDIIRIVTLALDSIEVKDLLNGKDIDGETPLHLACKTGNIVILQTFIQVINCIEKAKTNKDEIKDEKVALLTPQMIEESTNFFATRNKQGNTPFHSAVNALIELSTNKHRNLLTTKATLIGFNSFINGTANMPNPYQLKPRRKTFFEIQNKQKKRNLMLILDTLYSDERNDISWRNDKGQSIFELINDNTNYFAKTGQPKAATPITPTTPATTTSASKIITQPLISFTRNMFKMAKIPKASMSFNNLYDKNTNLSNSTLSKLHTSMVDLPPTPKKR